MANYSDVAWECNTKKYYVNTVITKSLKEIIHIIWS